MPGMALPDLSVSLLGSMEVRLAGVPVVGFRVKAKWMLAYLVLQRGKQVDYEALGRLLWPEASDRTQVIGSVRQCVSNLNTLLGAERFTKSSRSTIGLDPAQVNVDLFAFETAARTASPEDWRRAVELYTGDLLADCTEAWIQAERETCRHAYQRLLEALTEQAQKTGDFGAAERYLRLGIATDRWKEANRCSLMRLLMRRGEYNAALDVYDQYRRLQQDPTRDAGPEMRGLREAIRRKVTQERGRTGREVTAPGASALRLPHPARTLVGRTEALDEITSLFLFARLVTLKGPPGIGKTHLALHVALQLQEEYPDGTAFFDLTEEKSARDLWRALAYTLQIPDRPQQSLPETVCGYLELRQMLLVLDNCEHLIHSGAGVLREILQECPYIRILATSRIAWDAIPGERIYTVAPLRLPAASLLKRLPSDPLPDLSAFAAVQLFLERVREIRAGFVLTAQNAGAVAQICHLLDGVPLALLLAAGWIQTLTPEQIRDHLEQGMDLLHTARQTASVGQERLMLTLEASYQSLPPPQQAFFRRLAVFAGGWTLAAAEAVCQTPHLLESLRHLQECSLIEAEQEGTEMRFRLLSVLRQFGERLLIRHGEVETMRHRHLDLYVQIAEGAEVELMGPQQAAILARLDREAENLTAALTWACESGATVKGLRMAGALWRFWSMRGHYRDGLGWLEKLLHQEPREVGAVRARALGGAGNLAYQLQNYAQAQEWFQQRLAFEQTQGHPLRLAAALGSLANVASDLGDYGQARNLFERAHALFEEAGDPRGCASVQSNLAVIYVKEGKLAEACALQEACAAGFRAIGDSNHLAIALNNSVDIRLSLHEPIEAIPLLLESLEIGRALESRHALVHSLTLSVFLLTQMQALEPAARLLGAAQAFIERTRAPLPPEAQEAYRRTEEQTRAGLSEASFRDAYARGAALTLEETIEFAYLALKALLIGQA